MDYRDYRWDPCNWEFAVDQALTTVDDCIGADDVPKLAIQRLINAHCHLSEQYWVSGISHILQLVQFYNTKPETALAMIEELWEARVNPPEKEKNE